MKETETIRLYDGMSDEYDDIKDLWYAWLLSRLHYFIAQFLLRTGLKPPQNCLDIGCGTGFQSILLSLFGYQVSGIDISTCLISKAKKKIIGDYLTKDLFQSPIIFTKSYSEIIRRKAEILRGSTQVIEPQYFIGSATHLPFRDESFDLVNCCGSTLSSIDDYEVALSEISRVLKPGGIILLEAESRYNLDLIWPIIDTLLFGAIGFDQPIKISLRNLSGKFKEHVKTNFPFSTHTSEVMMTLWLFSSRKLIEELEEKGITIKERQVIHNFTNLIPSVILDHPDPSKFLRNCFYLLSVCENFFNSSPIFRHFGCSLVLFGEKTKKTKR